MADVDIAAIRAEWVGRIFQELDLVVDGERMLDWALSCGETDPRFIDSDHPDFQASTAFPSHVNAARMLPDDFTQIGSGPSSARVRCSQGSAGRWWRSVATPSRTPRPAPSEAVIAARTSSTTPTARTGLGGGRSTYSTRTS